MNKGKYYAVAVGRKVGIVESWIQCSLRVNRYPGAKFKSFQTIEEAENFIKCYSGTEDSESQTAPRHRQRSRDRDNSSQQQRKPEQVEYKLPEPSVHLLPDYTFHDGRCEVKFMVKTSQTGNERHFRTVSGYLTHNEAKYEALVWSLQTCIERKWTSVIAHVDPGLATELSKDCCCHIYEERIKEKWKQTKKLLSQFAYIHLEAR